MTPERWHQIEDIFHEVVDLGREAREKLLAERVGDDEELRAEVEKLIEQFAEASSFIEQPLYDSDRGGVLSALLDESDEDPMLGAILGSYQLQREIGRGGMGAVYEATRADGEFRLRAAVKVVKRGIDTDFVLRRFRNERQILAALDHPYITRLIDGGTTPDGRPYFVMDFVDGSTLYRYADKNGLTVEKRLELFCRICEAVEHAHKKLVIHRDLKPSNIFVTDDGSPRLLDFGIAKLLDSDMAAETLQPTATALRMMTVDYASPEQIKGEKVTFATDVYSLGVILFEFLTGFRPYRVENRSAHEVARAICDEEPFVPSEAPANPEGKLWAVKVNTNATTLTGLYELRREAPARISEKLKGNLDNIILKALQKRPRDRYSTVAEFRQDIEKHLRGETLAISLSPRMTSSNTLNVNTDGGKLVAVLPLSLMSPSGMDNTDEAYLTVGLADAIITRLTSVRKLTVRPTSSITQYNKEQINPFRAGIELGVDFVLDGRIRRFGERLRISLQLLDVKAFSAIWAGQFDECITGVLDLEDAISEQVAAVLIPHLTGEEKQKLAKRGTNSPQAYEEYLKGRFYWNQFTAQSLPKALECFERAVEIDPEYALAHVGVADFYIWANIYGLLPASITFDKANTSVRRALDLDNELGEAYASLALIYINQFQYKKAEELFLKAIDLNPNYSLAHEWYSAQLVGGGRIKEGLAEIRKAESLDPLSLRTKIMVVWSYYQAREYETSLATAEEIIKLDANYPQGHLQRGYVLCELGRAEEGLASIEHAMELMPGSTLAMQEYALALASAGRMSEASKVAENLKELAKREYVKPMFIGLACVAARQFDEAFEYFNIAVDESEPWMEWFGTDTKLDPIRSDPRYTEIMRRIGKAETPQAFSKPAESEVSTTFDSLVANTSHVSEMPTREFRFGFIKRHYGKMAAAALILFGVVSYATGFLTFEYKQNDASAVKNTLAGRSVAVLPFENQTGDPANDYLSDGISENLIDQLTNLQDIRIISRSAAFSYRTKQMDARAIGRELGVDLVLVGSVTKEKNDYTVKTELVNVVDDKRLFSMYFVEDAERVYALPIETASRILETLNVNSRAKMPDQKSYTQNNEAFQLYLKGEFHRQKATPADTKESIDFYEKAVKLDPNYALAYQGLALAYRSAPAYGTLLPKDAYPRATEAAQRALSIDPGLSTALVSLASIKATYDWNFTEAEKEYKQAIAIAPNNGEAHYSYGNFLVAMGRGDEALKEFRIAQQMDPLSLNIQTNIGWAMYIAGRYDEAVSQVRQVIERDPNFARAYLSLGEIQQEQGKYEDALTSIQKARQLSRDPLADMAYGHVLATAGRRAEATQIAEELEEKVRQNAVSPFLPAVVYAGLGEKDKSFYWLERAYQERSNWLSLIKVGRRLKPLHGDPRFDDLLKRVGFTS